MKFIYLTALSLLLFSSKASAQERPKIEFPHEFTASTGAFSMGPEEYELYDSPTYFGSICPKEFYSSGRVVFATANIAYAYRFHRLFTLEARLVYGGSSERYNDLYSDARLYATRVDRFSIMPIARLHWYNSRMVSLYSSFGVGISISRVKNGGGIPGRHYTQTDAALQFNLIGLRVGRRLFGFTEVGAGTSGVWLVGIGYKL